MGIAFAVGGEAPIVAFEGLSGLQPIEKGSDPCSQRGVQGGHIGVNGIDGFTELFAEVPGRWKADCSGDQSELARRIPPQEQ